MGVIDVGSNSVLALVAERLGAHWRRVWEDCRVTALGEGVSGSGLLREAAMARTAGTVDEFHRLALEHGAERVTVVGTMAIRVAENREDFRDRLRARGIDLRVLSGEDEARLSYLSVARDPVFGSEGIGVIDIGGASTEISTTETRASKPVGTLWVSRELLGPGPCGSEEIFRAGAEIDRVLAGTKAEVRDAVTVGATGVNLACFQRGMPEHDPHAVHGDRLDLSYVAESAMRLAKMAPEERDVLPGLEPGRGPVMHGGALILERVLHLLRVERVGVSDRGLRWALLDEA